MTLAEELAAAPVHSLGATARFLALDVSTTGRLRADGGRPAVRQLIRDGKLEPVDRSQPEHRWTVATTEILRYTEHGPRLPEKPLRRVS